MYKNHNKQKVQNKQASKAEKKTSRHLQPRDYNPTTAPAAARPGAVARPLIPTTASINSPGSSLAPEANLSGNPDEGHSAVECKGPRAALSTGVGCVFALRFLLVSDPFL